MASTIIFSSMISLSPSSISKKSFANGMPLYVSTKQPPLASNFIANSTLSANHSSSTETPIELRYPAFPTVMDINQIRKHLPHRYPFLLVDRLVENTPGVSAVGIKNVTINEYFFPGHIPDRPVMPGVLIVEAMAQVGGLILVEGTSDPFLFGGVDKLRFRKLVIAGDTLVIRMNLFKMQKRFGLAKFEGKAYVGGELVCDGEFLLVRETQ